MCTLFNIKVKTPYILAVMLRNTTYKPSELATSRLCEQRRSYAGESAREGGDDGALSVVNHIFKICIDPEHGCVPVPVTGRAEAKQLSDYHFREG